MDSLKKVLLLPADQAGCGNYRMIIPANIIASNKLADVKVSFEVRDDLMQWADLIVWQRQYKPNLLEFAKKYKALGKKQVFEIDDDLWSLTPANPAYVHYPHAVLKQLNEFINTCDAITCSTEPLKQVLVQKFKKPTYVLPNSIISNYIIPPNEIKDEIRIGWIGSAHHHDDLKYAIHAIKDVHNKYKNTKLVFMGGTIDKYLDMFDRSRTEYHNWVDFKQYYDKLNSMNLHIGLAPIEDNKFNCSKSNLRWAEYTMTGAATIASDVYPYSNTIENDKDGIIVKKNRHLEWLKSLTNIVENPEKITELCSSAQLKLRDKFDYYKNIGSWVNVYNEVLGDTKRIIINSEVSSGYVYTKPEYKGNKEIQIFSKKPSMEGMVPELLKHTTINESEINNILIVKLDHLGDVILTIPAMKMIRDKFPKANITLLCGNYAKAIAERVPYIDDIVTFDFFNERSENGQRQFTQEELKELKKVCTSKEFDLAIDLRRHPETRGVLDFTNAKYKIGYWFYQNNYDFLTTCVKIPDNVHDKKGPAGIVKPHITAQVCHMVRSVFEGAPNEIPEIELKLKESDNKVFEKHSQLLNNSNIICIHPGTGAPVRQWPLEYYAELCNLFIEKDNSTILLVGSKAERGLADLVYNRINKKENVVMLCGEIGLGEFLAVLPKCKLFIGNNSGPSHMAGVSKVPTLVTFSGQVSPYEWQPIGPKTALIRTDMDCAPCSLGRPEQCCWDLECLRFIKPETVYEESKKFLVEYK